MNLEARNNAAFELGMTYFYNSSGDPVDLTGVTPWMQIRNKAGGTTVYYDSDLTNHFTVNVSTGTISLLIPVEEVSTWTFNRAEWDIVLIYPDTQPRPFMSGTITLETGVTKSDA